MKKLLVFLKHSTKLVTMADQDDREYAFEFQLKVSFDLNVQVLEMCVWQYAYRNARIGSWKEDYLNRMRFMRRIRATEKIISPILTSEHRTKIHNKIEKMAVTFK